MQINTVSKFIGMALAAFLPLVAKAAIDVTVLDRKGRPVGDVVVFAKAEGLHPREQPPSGVMDQIDGAFTPHILVVQKGASVSFPNSDTVAHHVYSFSKPNQFVLPLYKGSAPPPHQFRHEGIATLGCNIHDNMLGYIVVVDSTVFGKTDTEGKIRLEFENQLDGVEISIWSPRIRGMGGYRSQTTSDGTSIEFRLEKRLKRPHDPNAWLSDDY
ncbi:MAG: methylamine utilization protein [Pseudomonadota bacterium]